MVDIVGGNWPHSNIEQEIREFYDKLNSGGKPEEVVEVLSFIQKSIEEVEVIREDVGRELSKNYGAVIDKGGIINWGGDSN